MSYGQTSALLEAHLIRDMLCLYSAPRQQFYTLISFGDNVCGHKASRSW